MFVIKVYYSLLFFLCNYFTNLIALCLLSINFTAYCFSARKTLIDKMTSLIIINNFNSSTYN